MTIATGDTAPPPLSLGRRVRRFMADYPIVPLVFLAFYAFLLVTMLLEKPGYRLTGLGLIAIGAVVYYAFAKRTPAAPEVAGDAEASAQPA